MCDETVNLPVIILRAAGSRPYKRCFPSLTNYRFLRIGLDPRVRRAPLWPLLEVNHLRGALLPPNDIARRRLALVSAPATFSERFCPLYWAWMNTTSSIVLAAFVTAAVGRLDQSKYTNHECRADGYFSKTTLELFLVQSLFSPLANCTPPTHNGQYASVSRSEYRFYTARSCFAVQQPDTSATISQHRHSPKTIGPSYINGHTHFFFFLIYM